MAKQSTDVHPTRRKKGYELERGFKGQCENGTLFCFVMSFLSCNTEIYKRYLEVSTEEESPQEYDLSMEALLEIIDKAARYR